MKMKKILLPGMLAALAFAACTNEEIATLQTEKVPEVDLSNRPMVGQVDLNFGPQTRMGLGSGYNGFDFSLNDKLGARLIDKVTTDATKKSLTDPQFHYVADDSYAYSNYAYTRDANGKWTTEALLVEGNYMFYAPYDEQQRGRGPLKVTFPITQNVNPKSEQVALLKGNGSANVDAIKEFFSGENGYTAFIGHYFLDASEDNLEISPAYNHLYAYPVFTLVNNYVKGSGSAATPEDITINRVIIESDNIYSHYTAKHSGIMTALQDAASEKKSGTTHKIDLGDWRTVDGADPKNFLLNETTAQILTPVTTAGTDNGDITVEFNPALTIKAGESFSFHVVMPAAKYAKSNLTITPVFEDEDGNKTWAGRKFVITETDNYTFAPGMWCPSEEYNMTSEKPVYKESAGSLTKFSIEGNEIAYNPPAKGLTSAKALAEWLEKNNFDHSIDLVESDQTFTFATEKIKIDGVNEEEYSVVRFDSELMDVIEKYLATGSIKFKSNMLAKGDLTGDYAVDGNKYIFNGGLDQLNGKIALSGTSSEEADIAGDSRFMGEATLTNVNIDGAAVFNGVATLTNVNIGDAAVFNGKATLTDVTANGTTINGAESVVQGASILGETTVLKNAEIKGSTKVSSLAVRGAITVKYNSTNDQSGNMTISEDATVNLSKAYPAAITVGAKKTTGDKAMTKGILNIKESQSKAITLTMGDVTIDAGKSIAAKNLTWNDDYATTLNNKGTITVETAGTFEVPANGTYQHNGTVSGGAIEVAADGTIENNGDIIVAENNGTIKAMNAETHTTVSAGNGTIGNDYLAYVSANAGQTVYYTFKTDVKDADLTSFDSETYAINKLIFDENIKVALSDLSTADLDEVKTVEFKNGSSLSVGANGKIGVNIETVEINGGVKFSGFAKDKSGFGFKKGATININPNATLEVAYLQLVTMSNTNGLNFNLKSETGKNTGVLKITDAIVALGKAAAPAHTIDDVSTITNSYYNGTTLVNQAAAAVNDAFNNPAIPVVRLVDDLSTGSAFVITRTVTVDLNGKDLEMKNTDNAGAFTVNAGGKLTIKDSKNESVISAIGQTADIASNAVRAIGGEVIIEGGIFKAYDDQNGTRNDAIYADAGGKITINGGKFEYVGTNADGHKYLLNCKDKTTAQITVNGGEFKNHVPSYEATGAADWSLKEVVLGANKKVYKWDNANNKFVTPKTAITTAHTTGSETWYKVD